MADSREIRQQELARLLLQKARQDLALVENVGDAETVADEIIGFHVQQVIEKALKSVLTRLGIQYEYTQPGGRLIWCGPNWSRRNTGWLLLSPTEQ